MKNSVDNRWDNSDRDRPKHLVGNMCLVSLCAPQIPHNVLRDTTRGIREFRPMTDVRKKMAQPEDFNSF